MAIVSYNGTATGNRIKITLGGKTVGLIQSLSAQENVGLQPVSGIGSPIPVEHVPTQTSISLTVDTIVFDKNFTNLPPTLASGVEPLGESIIPKQFGALSDGGTAGVLDGTTFDILILHNGHVLRRYNQCSYGGGSISFQKHQMVVQNAQFMAVDYNEKDETSAANATPAQ